MVGVGDIPLSVITNLQFKFKIIVSLTSMNHPFHNQLPILTWRSLKLLQFHSKTGNCRRFWTDAEIFSGKGVGKVRIRFNNLTVDAFTSHFVTYKGTEFDTNATR